LISKSAYAAYLRTRAAVAPERIGYLGWSNGGSAGLVTLSLDAPGIQRPSPRTGFAAALIFYPACGLKGQFEEDDYVPYASVKVFHGTADQKTSSARCAAFVERSRKLGGEIFNHSSPRRDPWLRRSEPQASAQPGQRRRDRGRGRKSARFLRAAPRRAVKQ
jgi:dienelactone hydrolase